MKNSLRVVHFSNSWLPQTQTWLYTQISNLPPTISTFIFCEQLENLDQFDHADLYLRDRGLSIFQQLEKRAGFIRRARRTSYFKRVARQLRPHILHSHFGNVGWENMRLALQSSLQHVVTFYGFDVNQLPVSDARWYPRYAALFESAALFLCEGPHMASCLEQLGCPEHKLRVHHLGASVDQIEYRERSWNATQPLKLLIASSFVEKKGIPYALTALRDLRPELDFELTIIGDASHEKNSQNEKRKILAAIEEYGLSNRTTLLGYQPQCVSIHRRHRRWRAGLLD
jgi:colanic acid/amylovoran biosynthesis glycosyltransferase